MKVLVAGAGAIGQWLGLRLDAAGHDVTLLGRQAHVDAARSGLRIRGHTEASRVLKAATTPDEARGPFDGVLITAKAHQTAALATATAPLLDASGWMASLQNGLGNDAKILRAVPPERAALALTSHGIMVESPGRLFHAGTGPTIVGPAKVGVEGAAREAFGLLAQAGLEPAWQDDLQPFVWRKAILNGGINPLGALEGARNGAILEKRALLARSEALVREGVEVAGQAGIRLPPGDAVAILHETLRRTAQNKCSMLQDAEAHRPLELEQITGRIVRLADRLGVPAPESHAIYAKAKALEASYLGQEASEALRTAELAWEASLVPSG